MPTFCRHNRFLERCPICSKTLPGAASQARPARAQSSARAPAPGASSRHRRQRGESVTVHRELRAQDDGYRSELVPGVRASADAARLAGEIAFANGRLLALGVQPPGLYGEIHALAGAEPERATWACFLTAYLCPLETDDPFAGIRLALQRMPDSRLDASSPPDLSDIPLGPRSSHERARGAETLIAYGQWVQRSGRPDGDAGQATDATQARAFTGDRAWTPQRRFERVFERLALPGLGRPGRYELLVTLGRLGVYELLADSLQLAGTRGPATEDPTTLAAKRVFGIGDPLLLERRAAALAEAVSVPIEALDLALCNWLSPRRSSIGFPPQTSDERTLGRANAALGV
jgi:hypothetical protein